MSSEDSATLRETPPDDGAEFRDAAEQIEFLAAVREAEANVAEGRLVPHEDMQNRLDAWLTA